MVLIRQQATFTLLALVILLSLGLQSWLQYCYYSQSLGFLQPWRWITAHYVHLNYTHYGLNMAGLLLLGWIYPQIRLGLLLSVLTLLPLCISGYFYWSPYTQQGLNYVGFSGVLHGLYVAIPVYLWHTQQANRWDAAMVVLVVVKIAIDFSTGSVSTTLLNANSYLPAHLSGLLGGAIIATVYARWIEPTYAAVRN